MRGLTPLFLRSKHFDKKTFSDLLEVSERKYIKKINTGLRKIRDKKSINNDILNEVFDCLGYNPSKITTNKLQEGLDQNSVKKHIYKNIPIKITNILGAIGLIADYAFLVNFDDQYL